MKGFKSKKGISLIVLVITIIVMIILAAAIILSISNSGIMDKANKAKKDSDAASLKEYVNVLQAEWELMSESERETYGTVKTYVTEQVGKKGISLDGKYVTETGDIITDSIIAYVEYLKEQKGPMANWDDITVTNNTNSYVYTDKGFEFEYAGVKYVYIYAMSNLHDDGSFDFDLGVVTYLGRDNTTSNVSTTKMVVEVPEGVQTIYTGGFNGGYATIFPESFTDFVAGLFYGKPDNLKEIKINATSINVFEDCGIGSSASGFPDTCRIFYQDKEMTVNEFTKLFQ